MDYSVAICTYNGQKYLEEQLKSIVEQSYPPIEIVLCDDCSTDSTILIAKQIASKFPTINWKIEVNEKNYGYTRNFEKAISKCSSEIIFLSDQDDVWIKTKAELIIKKFYNPDILCVFSDAEIVDEELCPLGTSMFQQLNFNEEQQNDFSDNYFQMDLLLRQYLVTGATMAIRRKILENITPIPENKIYIHDAWIATMCSILGKVDFIQDCLIQYRQHSNNAIGAGINHFAKYPEGRKERLDYLIRHHYEREKVVYDYLARKEEDTLPRDEQRFLNKRIQAYGYLLSKDTFVGKLFVLFQIGLLRRIPEFKNPRLYIGNSLIYLFNLK